MSSAIAIPAHVSNLRCLPQQFSRPAITQSEVVLLLPTASRPKSLLVHRLPTAAYAHSRFMQKAPARCPVVSPEFAPLRRACPVHRMSRILGSNVYGLHTQHHRVSSTQQGPGAPSTVTARHSSHNCRHTHPRNQVYRRRNLRPGPAAQLPENPVPGPYEALNLRSRDILNHGSDSSAATKRAGGRNVLACDACRHFRNSSPRRSSMIQRR